MGASAWLMRLANVVGCHRRRSRRTTVADPTAAPADDLVKRDFMPAAPDRLYVADITYVRTWEGWLYLAVVLDAFSRRVVGWAMAEHLRTELVLEALGMAVWQRRPAPGVVFHSDSEYVGAVFPGGLTLTAMDASGARCRAVPVPSDPHFRLTRCLSSDLSAVREHPARRWPRRGRDFRRACT